MTPRRFSEALNTFSEARCAVRKRGAAFYTSVRGFIAPNRFFISWCAVLYRGAPFYVVVRDFIYTIFKTLTQN
jgi:hypothetical protein